MPGHLIKKKDIFVVVKDMIKEGKKRSQYVSNKDKDKDRQRRDKTRRNENEKTRQDKTRHDQPR